MNHRAKYNFMRMCPLLRWDSIAAVRELGFVSSRKTFGRNTVIFQQGNSCHRVLYFLVEGEVKLIREAEKTLTKYAFFYFYAFFSDKNFYLEKICLFFWVNLPNFGRKIEVYILFPIFFCLFLWANISLFSGKKTSVFIDAKRIGMLKISTNRLKKKYIYKKSIYTRQIVSKLFLVKYQTFGTMALRRKRNTYSHSAVSVDTVTILGTFFGAFFISDMPKISCIYTFCWCVFLMRF